MNIIRRETTGYMCVGNCNKYKEVRVRYFKDLLQSNEEKIQAAQKRKKLDQSPPARPVTRHREADWCFSREPTLPHGITVQAAPWPECPDSSHEPHWLTLAVNSMEFKKYHLQRLEEWDT